MKFSLELSVCSDVFCLLIKVPLENEHRHSFIIVRYSKSEMQIVGSVRSIKEAFATAFEGYLKVI